MFSSIANIAQGYSTIVAAVLNFLSKEDEIMAAYPSKPAEYKDYPAWITGILRDQVGQLLEDSKVRDLLFMPLLQVRALDLFIHGGEYANFSACMSQAFNEVNDFLSEEGLDKAVSVVLRNWEEIGAIIASVTLPTSNVGPVDLVPCIAALNSIIAILQADMSDRDCEEALDKAECDAELGMTSEELAREDDMDIEL